MTIQKITPVILHLSDLHLGRDRRINATSASYKSALDYLYEDLAQLKNKPRSDWPNVLIISGDLSSYYDHKDYYNAKLFINKIQNLFDLGNNKICIVPGNHDVSLPKRREAIQKDFDKIPYIYEEEFRQILGSDFIQNNKDCPYYWQSYPEMKLFIFGFDSNMIDKDDFIKFSNNSDIFNECLRCGRIGKKQLDTFKQLYHTKKKEISDFEDFTKIAVLHHHVIPIPSEELKPFSILTDAGSFLETLSEYDIDIILHGHEHCPFMAKIIYNSALKGKFYEKELLILGAGSAGADRINHLEKIKNHYSIIRINNRKIHLNPIEIDIEWRHNNKVDFDFNSFPGLKPIKLKEKAVMPEINQELIEAATTYKLKEIKIEIKIKENGYWERTTEVHAVSTIRRLTELRHFIYIVDSPEETKYSKPKIQYLGGIKVKEDPEIEIEGNCCYLYVIPENPLKLNEETRYKWAEQFDCISFFMSQEDYHSKYPSNGEKYFEFFSFQAVRTVEFLEIKIIFPEGYLKAMAQEAAFVKATIGDEKISTPDSVETKRIKFEKNENSIRMTTKNLKHSMTYMLCWYPPEKWDFNKNRKIP